MAKVALPEGTAHDVKEFIYTDIFLGNTQRRTIARAKDRWKKKHDLILADSTVRKWYAEILKVISEIGAAVENSENRALNTGLAEVRLLSIYQSAMADKDWKIALDVIKQLTSIQGIGVKHKPKQENYPQISAQGDMNVIVQQPVVKELSNKRLLEAAGLSAEDLEVPDTLHPDDAERLLTGDDI